LESSIACIAGRYAYESETLSGIGLGGFKKGQVPKVVTTRAEQGQGNPYLKDDISIVTTVNACKEKYATNLRLVNANLPLWMGTPPLELVNCFDPGIERITISPNPQSKVTEAQVSFKRKAGGIGQCHLLPLDEILSSGTIKGMTLFPMIIAVLVNGGYLIVDELENHLNKKVIEFFIGLFTDCKTNPHGACLVFSTHYAEVLDCITRKDNIYITTRDEANFLSLQRLSDSPRVQRSDLLKSRIFLSNVVAGTAPNKIDLDQAKRRIQDMLEAR
ncbi:MAG: ATP-binding protein, partial [Succinivibrionaceae bacterium]|nr:ATP-binding protein [Succinivibrionaceae bacterium]